MKLKEPVGDKAPVSPSDKDLDLGEGTNLRTSETGAVKGSYFHILPAIEAPPPKLLVRMNGCSKAHRLTKAIQSHEICVK